ncbi:MAG: response regulator [Acidobacteria bacterium]|nr:response regulator [Acidobacteriota bacterium]
MQWAGLAAASLVLLVLPLSQALVSFGGARRTLEAEASLLARSVERIVVARPALWEYESLRLQEVLSEAPVGGALETRVLRGISGTVLVEWDPGMTGPSIRSTVPVHDSGQVVAYLECRRSVSREAGFVLLAGMLGLVLGALLLLLFRFIPVRILEQVLSDFEDERALSLAAFRAIQDAVIAVDQDQRIAFMNPMAGRMLGRESSRCIGLPLEEVYRPRVHGVSGGTGQAHYGILTDPQGRERILEERRSAFTDPHRGAGGTVFVIRDITEKIRTESDLLRVKQVESLGVLAGGIAHDFNNYLSGILGNLTLALEYPVGDHRIATRIRQAVQATERAKDLSLRLLVFAKGGEPVRRVTALQDLVREASELALRGRSVGCTYDFPGDLWNAEVDPGLLSQVVHNITLNAVQAIDGDGRIDITAQNVVVPEGNALPVSPGPFVVIRIRDSGPGIPAELMDRIFEPYFTTKPGGHGLGLASSYNIMRSHGGCIGVESVPGEWTEFTLHVPATESPLTGSQPAAPPLPFRGAGRILVMDDDPIILDTTREILEHFGFEVETALDGRSAVSAWETSLKEGKPFRAAIMDLTIPGGMGGKEAARGILALDPGALLMVTSGYNADPVMSRPREFGFSAVVSKPYAALDLLRELQGLLGEEQSPGASDKSLHPAGRTMDDGPVSLGPARRPGRH